MTPETDRCRHCGLEARDHLGLGHAHEPSTLMAPHEAQYAESWEWTVEREAAWRARKNLEPMEMPGQTW